jgi:hypothetical protein
LLTLVLPLDPDLRAYDADGDVYPVLGLVQYCNEGIVDGEPVHHVGVGFIGKKLPESFKSNPCQSYRITGMGPDGLWTITEAGSVYKPRRNPRFWLGLQLTISLLRKEKGEAARFEAMTQNISANGLSLLGAPTLTIGEKVKVACKPLNFYAIAIVRNMKTKPGQPPTLHLEFVEAEFPVDKLVSLTTEGNTIMPPAGTDWRRSPVSATSAAADAIIKEIIRS